mmetsp:Transcript_30057/g.65542  ORF Transcript_30057/g.65542 Transcript_30057/m.65542 type:complete len:208 (-) Transcript_30057:31-654(-)
MPKIRVQALHMSSRDDPYFSAAEAQETAVGENNAEVSCNLRSQEIDERIADVAFVVHIHGQIEEVKGASKAALVDLLQKLRLRVLVRDIPQHHGGDWHFARRTSSGLCSKILWLWDAHCVVGLEATFDSLCSHCPICAASTFRERLHSRGSICAASATCMPLCSLNGGHCYLGKAFVLKLPLLKPCSHRFRCLIACFAEGVWGQPVQ